MNHLFTITKSDGTQELFEEEKLRGSLTRVGASPEAIDDVLATVTKTMKNGMKTGEIYHHAFSLLKKHSQPAAVKYSIRRALTDLGPDGFPFEKFVARIFEAWGYKTVTDQKVLGRCISHEIDVVAWKADSLAMVEVKFHHEAGLRSDSKVALYIEARREDVQDTFFDYGGTKRKISEFWLVTNTKFTDQAITYAECHNLKLLGWNHPAENNLHEIIEKNKLHPITCLTTIAHDQKRNLIARGIVTCKDLIADPHALGFIGIAGPFAEKVIEEAHIIIEG